MSRHPARFVEDLTAEEKTEARLTQLDEHAHVLLRAFKAAGVPTGSWGGTYVVRSERCFCHAPLPIDPEHPDPTRPRIVQNGLYCVMHETTLTPRQACDKWMKTPAQKAKFLQKVFPHEPQGTDHFVVEAGERFERRGIDSSPEQALYIAEAVEGESVRVCIVRCRDKALATEIVERRRDELPWRTDVKLRPDGSLPASWHGGPLSGPEQETLRLQQEQDRAAKRERRDRVIREMQREPL